jgi:hypothetical protein
LVHIDPDVIGVALGEGGILGAAVDALSVVGELETEAIVPARCSKATLNVWKLSP